MKLVKFVKVDVEGFETGLIYINPDSIVKVMPDIVGYTVFLNSKYDNAVCISRDSFEAAFIEKE